MKGNIIVPQARRGTTNARLAWRALNGVFAAYKPPEVTYIDIQKTIIMNLCKDLNGMYTRPPINYVRIEGDTTKKMNVCVSPSYADHPLVVGPRYQPEDFKLSCANYLHKDISGLLIFGINSGYKWVHKLKDSKLPVNYKIKGILGQATDNFYRTGKIVEKATYKFIKRTVIDKICAAMQASHQKTMFELCGLNIQSQAAYELAVQGLVRPMENEIPMIYSIKCVDFKLPEFTLEIVCLNENDMYLKSLIHNLGLQLHSVATCTEIKCIRYGLFDLNHALLKKHWQLQHIFDNMEQLHGILKKNDNLLEQDSAILTEPNSSSKLPQDCESTYVK